MIDFLGDESHGRESGNAIPGAAGRYKVSCDNTGGSPPSAGVLAISEDTLGRDQALLEATPEPRLLPTPTRSK